MTKHPRAKQTLARSQLDVLLWRHHWEREVQKEIWCLHKTHKNGAEWELMKWRPAAPINMHSLGRPKQFPRGGWKPTFFWLNISPFSSWGVSMERLAEWEGVGRKQFMPFLTRIHPSCCFNTVLPPGSHITPCSRGFWAFYFFSFNDAHIPFLKSNFVKREGD